MAKFKRYDGKGAVALVIKGKRELIQPNEVVEVSPNSEVHNSLMRDSKWELLEEGELDEEIDGIDFDENEFYNELIDVKGVGEVSAKKIFDRAKSWKELGAFDKDWLNEHLKDDVADRLWQEVQERLEE